MNRPYILSLLILELTLSLAVAPSLPSSTINQFAQAQSSVSGMYVTAQTNSGSNLTSTSANNTTSANVDKKNAKIIVFE